MSLISAGSISLDSTFKRCHFPVMPIPSWVIRNYVYIFVCLPLCLLYCVAPPPSLLWDFPLKDWVTRYYSNNWTQMNSSKEPLLVFTFSKCSSDGCRHCHIPCVYVKTYWRWAHLEGTVFAIMNTSPIIIIFFSAYVFTSPRGKSQ